MEFVEGRLRLWVTTRRLEHSDEVYAVSTGFYRTFFEGGGQARDMSFRVVGSWRFKQELFTALVFLQIDLAGLGLAQAFVLLGSRAADRPLWSMEAYDKVCDFSRDMIEAIAAAMRLEKSLFNHRDRPVTLH